MWNQLLTALMYFSSGSWSRVALELKLMIGGISKLFIEKNLANQIKEQKSRFIILSILQSKRRFKYGECSSRKEVPPWFLQLCPSLPSAVFGLRACGKDLCFQVSSLCGQLAGKVEWMTRNLLLSRNGFWCNFLSDLPLRPKLVLNLPLTHKCVLLQSTQDLTKSVTRHE